MLLAAALFKRFSLLTLSNFAAGFAACFNSSLLPPNSSLVFFPFFQCGKQAAQADVDGAKVGDDQVILLARQVAKKIEDELDYPGQIKVSVIRESRATEYAK